MPGIVGIVSQRNEDLNACIENMIIPMKHRSWYRVQKKITPDMGVASISLDDEERILEGNSIILTVAGEIFDQDDLKVKPSDIGDGNLSQYSLSEILLKLYLEYGVKALCGLNGFYVISIWEGKPKKRLTIVNDRYGFRKLYYWVSRDRLMFAGEYKSIVWHPDFNRKIDEVGLSDFLSVGHLLDDRTMFEDIKLLPPASIMSYQQGELVLDRYWDYKFHDPEISAMDEDQCIDGLFLRLKDAVRRRAKEKTCLLLSGGLDSRTLAGTLAQCAEGLKVNTVTYGHKHSYDVRFGRKIASCLGYEHSFIPIRPSYMVEHINEGTWRIEGNAHCQYFFIFAVDDFLEENGFEYAMDGFLGDTLPGQDLPCVVMLKDRSKDEAVKFIYDHLYNEVFKDTELPAFLRPWVYKNIKGESFNSIKSSFESSPTDDMLDRCTHIELHQRQRRFGSAHIDILGTFSKVLDPFADNDFANFALSIPPEMKMDQRIYKRMIVKHLPEVARLPYTRTGIPLDNTCFHRTLRRFRAHFYNTLLPVFTKKRAHDFREIIHPADWLRTYSLTRHFAMDVLLNQEEYLEDYFNMDMVRSLVVDHTNRGMNKLGKICALITFSIWRRQFADSDPYRTPEDILLDLRFPSNCYWRCAER